MSFDVLPGYKTYMAAAGLFGLAIYQFTQKDYVSGFQSIFAGLAAAGIKLHLDNVLPRPVVPVVPVTPVTPVVTTIEKKNNI